MNHRNIFLWITATALLLLISACSTLKPVMPTPIPSTATPTEPPIVDILDIESLENQCPIWASSGSWIKVRGRLGAGFMTVCSQGWCLIDISQPDSSAYVSFNIRVGNSANPEPGTMMPIPNPYTDLDLKVWTHDKTWVQGGSEVTVILDAYDNGNNCNYWLKRISSQTSMPDSFKPTSLMPQATITTSADCTPMTPAPPSSYSGLVALWYFDEGCGDRVYDATENHNNGEIIGNINWHGGKLGSGLYLGNASFVEVPDNPSLHLPDSLTVAAWVYVEGTEGDRIIISKGNSTIGDGWHMLLRKGNALAVHARYGSAWELIESRIGIAVNEWHHIAFTFDGKTTRLYIDGNEVGAREFDAPIQQNERPLRIGAVAQNAGRGIFSIVDEATIFRRALTPEEILQLYKGQIP
jgi:Concanavalin A-like lectin/glucanases superfamily